MIEAIGDMNVLSSALNLKGGVIDSLVRDNIVVTTEQLKEISFICIEDRGLKNGIGGRMDEKSYTLEVRIHFTNRWVYDSHPI